MATYKIDSSLLTAQANEIRTLNGTTATMNPSQMTTALQSANAEVAEQEQKIIEITEMLQGKAMGGGSGTSVETCTVVINSSYYHQSYLATIYTDGAVNALKVNNSSPDMKTISISNVLCNSVIFLGTTASVINPVARISDGGAFLGVMNRDPKQLAFKVSDVAGGTMTVTLYDDD